MNVSTVETHVSLHVTSNPELRRLDAQHELPRHAKLIFKPQYASISVSGNLQCHIVKAYYLQHLSYAEPGPLHIWLANLRRHKIRYLHTSQPAFIRSSSYASHSVCLHVDEEHTLLLCHLITVFTTAYRHSKHLSCFENHCQDWLFATLWPLGTTDTYY